MPDIAIPDHVARRRAVLDGMAPLSRPGQVLILPGPAMTRHVLRGGDAAAAAVLAAVGLAVPRTACRAAGNGARTALWLGPDEWLLLAPADDAPMRALPDSFPSDAGSLVDVSHRQLCLLLSGPGAVDVLSSFCPLDLHPDAFPVGMCTRTVLAKAEIALWRTGPESFHLEVWRSFAAYVHGLLADALDMTLP